LLSFGDSELHLASFVGGGVVSGVLDTAHRFSQEHSRDRSLLVTRGSACSYGNARYSLDEGLQPLRVIVRNRSLWKHLIPEDVRELLQLDMLPM
jgi:hypothetical protein